MRSMRAIDRSDIVLMVINAEGIREYDKRIAGFAMKAEVKGLSHLLYDDNPLPGL